LLRVSLEKAFKVSMERDSRMWGSFGVYVVREKFHLMVYHETHFMVKWVNSPSQLSGTSSTKVSTHENYKNGSICSASSKDFKSLCICDQTHTESKGDGIESD